MQLWRAREAITKSYKSSVTWIGQEAKLILKLPFKGTLIGINTNFKNITAKEQYLIQGT